MRLQQTVFESGQVQAYCVDDTGIAKKGQRSVGVQRQYSGTLGKVGNCQVIVSLHGISDSFGSCLGLRLYLPQRWCDDAERRVEAKVPNTVEFQKKWQIALDLIDSAIANGAPSLPVLADAGYGDCRDFREALRDRGLKYAVGISCQTSVWPPGTELEIAVRQGPGRPRTQATAVDANSPVLVDDLAKELLDAGKFEPITWRMGSKGPLAADFAAVRVRSAEKRTKGQHPGQQEWLLIEQEKSGDFKYYLCSLSSRRYDRKLWIGRMTKAVYPSA